MGVESAPRFCVVVFLLPIWNHKSGGRPTCTADSLFTALGVVWHQIRGAAIGSQISPTLSNLAVTLIKISWSSTYQEVLTQPNFHHLAIRYVDNRFVIVQKHHLQAPVFKVFTDLDFYGSPVELELVADNLLLGFYVDVSERTVIYKLPDIRQIRDNVSAGTLRLRLSGLKSRAHLIRKYSFPSCQTQSSLHALSRLYVQKGFFALSDIHSALWPTNTSGDRPLCVGSTPVSKGVDPHVQRTHFFTALGVVWRQIRGAAIGSQISPTLSNLAVTLIEISWSSTYQEVLTQPNFRHLAIRYVDNRFVIVQKHHLQAPVFKVFTDLDFYGSPVELELVADNLLPIRSG